MMKIQREEGFTLLEVLMAVTVFAVGFSAALSMQLTSTKTNASSRLITEETISGSGQMEQLMGLPFTHQDLLDLVLKADAEGLPEPEDDPEIDMGRYNISWTVQDSFPAAGTKTVSMTITGNDRGLKKTIRLHKIISSGN